MKLLISVIAMLLLSSFSYSQSGRRAKEIKVPVPAPTPEVSQPTTKSVEPKDEPAVTAEKGQDYACIADGGLARILNTETVNERVLSNKEVDTRVVIKTKPKPGYTREARRLGVQGFVALKALLSSDGKVSRIRVVKGLPFGLTENAIRTACKIEFTPALKDGEKVSQWVVVEYVFRLADSSIFTP